jgi:phosphatidylserine decarboxylase
MKIHKEGHITIFITAVILVILYAIALTWNHWLSYVLFVIPVLLFSFIMYFFRSPYRKIPVNEKVLLSPADGKVLLVEENIEDEFFCRPMQQISIFMSPLNVHLNRFPADARVVYYKYHPGKYLVAWHPKSSKLNERTSIVFETPGGMQFLVRQIAGKIARRIVCYAKEGQDVRQGEELGFIKFGSRLDVFLPPGTRVLVKPGDIVTGGISALADLSA